MPTRGGFRHEPDTMGESLTVPATEPLYSSGSLLFDAPLNA